MTKVIYLNLSDYDFLKQWNKYKYKPNIKADWVSSHKILIMPSASYMVDIIPHNPILTVFMDGEFIDLLPEEAYHLSMENPGLSVLMPFIKGRNEYNKSKLQSLKLRIEIFD